MKTNLILFLGALLALSGLAGCGDGSSGSAGSAGTAGTAGTGGAGGTGGSAGTAGTGGSTAGSSGSAGTAGSGGSSAGPTCANYCTEIQANCTGDMAQYSDEAGCEGVCKHFDVGMSGATSGDTLGCREYHAGDPAKSDAKTHCPHAGPLGDSTCSTSDCEAFCKLAVAVCGAKAYADEATCMTSCKAYPDTMAVPYNATVTSGSSLACRMYHLSVAASSDANAMTHCPHVGEKSDPCQ